MSGQVAQLDPGSGLGKVAERASGARRKLARPAGREGRKGKKEGK